MYVAALQSGSNGNCLYVEAGGRRLLFDAGISGKRAQQRLAELGRDIRDVDALLISHDHSDHAAMAGIYHRKFALPVWVGARTLAAANRKRSLGVIQDPRPLVGGQTLDWGDLRVETIPTPHDGVDGVGFVIDDGHCRLGLLTDLGHVFSGLGDLLAGLDAVLLESNYDPPMLEAGPYPGFLKRRIAGPGGHLSNHEAAELVAEAGQRLQWLALGHLSGDNNTPEQAYQVHRQRLGGKLPICLTSRHGAVELPKVR